MTEPTNPYQPPRTPTEPKPADGRHRSARYEFLLKAQDGEQLQRAQEWLDSSEALLADFRIVPIDGLAADRFDVLRIQKRLRKIGRADLLIASVALSQDATLVTRNLRHFRQVPGLKLENWAD